MSTTRRIEVYKIGADQLNGWTASGAVRNAGIGGCFCPVGMYVLVEIAGRFGHVSRPRVVRSYDSQIKAVCAYERYLDASQRGRYAHDYEVWHVVDDEQIVGTPEHLSTLHTLLQGRMERCDTFHTIQCAYCGDWWCGPWVLKRGPIGAYYLCESCDANLHGALVTLGLGE